MQDTDKLAMLKTFLGVNDTSEDALLNTYLASAAQEILQYKYSYATNIPSTVDAEDEMTQIWAVVAGYNLFGIENQTSHSENGTNRVFEYSDMVMYIRNHITPYAKVCV